MSNYYVVPDGDDWAVRRADGERASARAGTQAEAQEIASGFAQNSGGGEVVIHRPNGQIRNSSTIGRPDPFPPRDTKH